MIKFFRKYEGSLITILTLYVIGPILTFIFIYTLLSNPTELSENIRVRGYFQNTFIIGIIGAILTISGIIKIFKK